MPEQQQPEQQQPVNQPVPGSPSSETPTSGYIPSQSDVIARQHEQPPQQEVVDPNIEELSTKLGINPDELGVETPPQEEKQEEKFSDPEDWYKQQFSNPEASKFVEDFKKYVGLDIKEVYGLIKETAEVTKGVDQWRQEAVAQQQLNTLKQEFGNEFDSLMPQILERFDQIRKVNPQQAQALDNPDGARLLAAKIKQEQSQGTYTQQRDDVPTYLPNRRQVSYRQSDSPVIKMSEFRSWSGEEMDRRYGDILRAKQNGTFIYDV